jgi:hypothetical protein
MALSGASTDSHDDFAPGAADARRQGRERPAIGLFGLSIQIAGGTASKPVKHNRCARVFRGAGVLGDRNTVFGLREAARGPATEINI